MSEQEVFSIPLEASTHTPSTICSSFLGSPSIGTQEKDMMKKYSNYTDSTMVETLSDSSEFDLGVSALSSSHRYENVLRANKDIDYITIPTIEARRFEKARAYSHEIPDLGRLVCGGCSKEISNTIDDKELCSRCSKNLIKA